MRPDQSSQKAAALVSVSFRQKIAITFTLLIVFVMLISVYLVTIQIKRASLGRAEESGRLLGKMIALSMGEDIVRGNYQGIDYALKEFVKLDKIDYCMILNNQGKIISSTHPSIHGKYFTDAWSRMALFNKDLSIRRAANGIRPVYDTSVPIVIGGKRYGLIRAGFTIDEEFSHIRNLLFYNLTLGIILILIGILIAYGISATLLSPLNAILNSIESISHGDYSNKAFLSTKDEFADLANSFNRLSRILQTRESTSNTLTKKILENNASIANQNFSGHLLESVVLHLEINRFNTFIERHSPSEAIDTLNNFITQTADIIAQADGIIDKFGEGYITAIFPIKRSDKWPAHLRAGFAALAARNNFNIFNVTQARLGLEELSLKSGLTLGKIIAGNIGTKTRFDFGVIGEKLAQARKTADLSTRKTAFLPVADKSFANKARDFLQFIPLQETDEANSDNDFYAISGFTNISYFRERIKTASPQGNISIIQAFGMTESHEGFAFLKEAITNSKCDYRYEALKALSPFMFKGSPEVRDFLQDVISNNTDPQLCSTALSVLSLSRDQSLTTTYVELTRADDDRVRANAVEALIPLVLPEKTNLFKNLLEDPAPRVCANALLGLWLADDQETLACLYALLKSDSSARRSSAAYATYFLANARKFRRLFPAYCEQENYLPIPVVENIFKRLKMMLESIDTSERYQALRAIGKIADHDTLPIVVEMLNHETEPEIIELGQSIVQEWQRLVTHEQ